MNDNALVWLVIGLTVGAFIVWLILGGKFRVTKEGLEVEIEGVLSYLREAATRKGAAKPDERVVRQRLQARTVAKKLPALKVLWVDDNPTGNLFERLALASIGVFVDSYSSNRDAISVLEAGEFKLVISDLRRTTGIETGWDLLSDLRKLRPQIPFVFYVGHIDDTIRQRAQELEAEITNDPTRLVQLVVAHIT